MIGLVVFLVLIAVGATGVAAYFFGLGIATPPTKDRQLQTWMNSRARMDAATREAMDAAYRLRHERSK